MKKGKQAFTPKARLIQILGEHLIKDATVGLLELVKNSYDADATHVQVVMVALNTEKGKIIVRDNGCGMDAGIFLKHWMNPASGHKEKQKQAQQRTQLGRLPLGEKGVGRFAAQQIGHILRIVSKVSCASLELVVELDWRAFEVADKDLNEIEIAYYEREAQDFRSDESGTLLEISELKSAWTEAEIRRISQTLKRLKSPFKGRTDFDVTLTFENCSDNFEKYGNLETSDIFHKAHYKLFGTVDEHGGFEFEYHFFVPGYKENYKKGKLDLLTSYGLNIPTPLVCGGFTVYLYDYETSPTWKWLQRSNIAQQDLEEFSGVSIYRDGMRIFPYGEKDNDWLELAQHGLQWPLERIVRHHPLIGMIEITQMDNPLLKDKTNREGLIENAAFEQFKNLVFCTLRVLEAEQIEDKPVEKQQWDVWETFQDLANDLTDMISTLLETPVPPTSQVVARLENITQQISGIHKSCALTFEAQNREKTLLFHLAGTGLTAERFTHEFARLVRGALDALGRLKKFLEPPSAKIKKELDLIYSSLEALRNDIRLLGPMFYVKKVANEKELDLKQIIQNTLALQERWLQKEAIHVEIQGATFIVKMREGSCMQIFNNLIDNAIFWLARKSELDKRNIRIILNSRTFSVFVSDTGSGVISRYKDKIFEPFFTTKIEDGRGLGLYIVKEILEEKNWDITLVSQDDYPEIGLLQGASFKITFAEKP